MPTFYTKMNTSREPLERLLRSGPTLHHTPDCIEPSTTKPDQNQRDDLEDLTRPLSEIYFDLQQRTEETLTPPLAKKHEKKMKKKTRGVPKPPLASKEPTLPQSDQEAEPQPTLSVDKRALKAFSTLFFCPSRAAKPGEVPWNDFLHAMKSAGFASEKLYGSVWQFTSSSLKVERRIQFHEPHPAGKIPFRTARRIGRRLNRAYGWRGDMFCLQSV